MQVDTDTATFPTTTINANAQSMSDPSGDHLM